MSVTTAKVGYHVDIERTCLESEWDGERFGDWHESWSCHFNGIYKLLPNQHSDVSSDFDFEVGEQVYVVWVNWSSGDSFGWARNKYAEPVGVFKTYEAAEHCRKWIREQGDDYDFKVGRLTSDKYTHTYESLDGQKLEIYTNTWRGYFETLENVEIEVTTIGAPKERTSY